jgi:hypothetical protein
MSKRINFAKKFSIKSNNNWKQFIKATINYNKFMFRVIKKELKEKFNPGYLVLSTIISD